VGRVPELPEVETVRRMLESRVIGGVVRGVRLSGLRLREPVSKTLPRRLKGRRLESLGRRGKYLIFGFDGALSMISHLGMSGRWLFHAEPPARRPPHVHVRIAFENEAEIWFEDPRRFGLLRLVATPQLDRDASLRLLGPDPMTDAPDAGALHALARGTRVSIKSFLLDQRRIAGIGNIYASEILYRARVDPRRAAGRLKRPEWAAISERIPEVLGEAIDRMGTTFSMYRTVTGEMGSFGEQLRVYDRAGEACGVCGQPIRRIVQAQRSTYFCARCQRRGA
jgi:formamidopyrimidine-DNA glycosylase